MNRKKGLFAVVAALAISSVMAAMAYTDGYVHNTKYFKVGDTNNALMAVIPHADAVGYKDITARDVNGQVVFRIGAGVGGTMFGLQPGSRYTWNELINLKNNSNDNTKVEFAVGGRLSDYLTITDNNTKTVVFANGNATPFVLNSNTEHSYKFEVIIPHDEALSKNVDDDYIQLNISAVSK